MVDKFLKGSNDNASVNSLQKIFEVKSKEWLEKTVDAFFIHSQVPIIGSVLYCNLALAFEHTGIYVGNGRVVHLNGEGVVEDISLKEFTERLDGSNLTNSIFCATDSNGHSIGSVKVAERAMRMVGVRRGYNFAHNNCHCFTFYCLTGMEIGIGSFTVVQEMLRKQFGFAKWRAIKNYLIVSR